jgi:hypothetical protein
VKAENGWLYVLGQTYPAEIEGLYWGNDLTTIVRVYSQVGTDYFYLVEEYTLDKACTPTCCCGTYQLHKLIGNEAGIPHLPNGLVLRQSSS